MDRKALAAVAAGALAVVFPWVAVPVVVLIALGAILTDGRSRKWILFLALPLGAVALARFAVEIAVPNLVRSGQHAAEDESVARLREIRWAEGEVLKQKWIDTDHDGNGEYALLGELSGTRQTRGGASIQAAIMRPVNFEPFASPALGKDGWVYLADGYLYSVYLPAQGGGWTAEGGKPVDAAAARERFRAYGWPLIWDRGGRRTLAIDVNGKEEHICQSDESVTYGGVAKVPPADAAFATGGKECGTGVDGGKFKVWKRKKGGASAR